MKTHVRFLLAALGVGIACATVACGTAPKSKLLTPSVQGGTKASGTFPAALASIAPKSSVGPKSKTKPKSTISAAGAGESALCHAGKGTPGGADPWGGCWPGLGNTGAPAVAQLVDIDSGQINPPNNELPSDNNGWKFSPTDGYITVTARTAVIDGIVENGTIYVPAGDSLTVKNSEAGYINDEGASLVVENSTLNGGSQRVFSTITGGSNITVLSSDISGGEHEVLCYSDCTVENSWLHDNYASNPDGAHQDGFLADGGTNFTLLHNSVFCTGGCTADISFLATDDNATVTRNLLVASPDSAFCVYPGPDSSSQSGIDNMVWENNVFQQGANGRCATYGGVYGWYPSDGTGNVWSGNFWSSGVPLLEP